VGRGIALLLQYGVVQRVGRGIAVLLQYGVVQSVGRGIAVLFHFTGDCLGRRTGLDGRKISSPPGFDPGPSSPVAQSLYRLSYRAKSALRYARNITEFDMEGPRKTTKFRTACLLTHIRLLNQLPHPPHHPERYKRDS